MAHFAKLGGGNIVEQVIVVSDIDADTEENGIAFLHGLFGDNTTWVQCSYNTFQNQYWDINDEGERELASDQSQAFRKNFPSVGWAYSTSIDGFIPPKPYPSWILDTTIGKWNAPVDVPTPEEGKYFRWNESTLSWTEHTVE
jgi:hypothetical protein